MQINTPLFQREELKQERLQLTQHQAIVLFSAATTLGITLGITFSLIIFFITL